MNSFKIRGKIVENGLTQTALADELGLSQSTLSQKINGYRPITRLELIKLKEVLQLTDDEFIELFFID